MKGKSFIFVKNGIMKNTLKTLLLAAACCLFVSNAYAQRYYDDRRVSLDRTGSVASYIDFHLGEGIGRGAKAIAGGNLSFLARLSPEFQFGVGMGLDYVHALALQGKLNKEKEYDYHGELTLPLFMRGRYLMGDVYTRGANFFIQCDFGYRFGISAYNTGKNKGVIKNLEKCNVKGLFFEPQLGIAINEIISLSFGLPIQHYNKYISELPIEQITAETNLTAKGLAFMGADLHFMINF
jgi:hypothetical protein